MVILTYYNIILLPLDSVFTIIKIDREAIIGMGERSRLDSIRSVTLSYIIIYRL